MLEVRASNVVMVTAVARVVCARGVAARTVRFGKGVNTEQSAKIQTHRHYGHTTYYGRATRCGRLTATVHLKKKRTRRQQQRSLDYAQAASPAPRKRPSVRHDVYAHRAPHPGARGTRARRKHARAASRSPSSCLSSGGSVRLLLSRLPTSASNAVRTLPSKSASAQTHQSTA